MDILKENVIDEKDWPEKLQEVAKRHQELLDKWQTFESVDPKVDKLRQQAHAAILKGYYDKADSLFERAVEVDDKAIAAQEENLTKRKVSKAQSLAAQADLAETKLNFSKAIELYAQALEVLPASKKTIQAVYLNNLGSLYLTTAQYAKAEPLMKRALAIDEASYGGDHPDVAVRLNNLAQLYRGTNRLTEAESLMKRALTIDQASLGRDHPVVARDLNNLAALYQATGRHKEAEPLMKRAMTIHEASLGRDHPDVAIDLNNLALLYRATGRQKEAEPLMKRMLEIFIDFTRRTGHRHPHLMTAFDNYTALLVKGGWAVSSSSPNITGYKVLN